MPKRLSPDARQAVLHAAADEALRRGDRRLGSEHLLLGVLHNEQSSAARALVVSLADARKALDSLDRAALASVGVTLTPIVSQCSPPGNRVERPLTSAARAVMTRALAEARVAKSRQIEMGHVVLALLDCKPPDPAGDLLGTLGIDVSAVRQRLAVDEVGAA